MINGVCGTVVSNKYYTLGHAVICKAVVGTKHFLSCDLTWARIGSIT